MRRFVMMVTAIAASLPWEVRVFVILSAGFAATAAAPGTTGMYICGGGLLVLACFVVIDRLDL